MDSGINFFIKNSLFTISIHAAHEGCDGQLDSAGETLGHFNPRSPGGLRPI